MSDGYHRCPECGFYIEDGTSTLCDYDDCPELAPERERPRVPILWDEDPPLYFGGR